jgi:hypothetical protein
LLNSCTIENPCFTNMQKENNNFIYGANTQLHSIFMMNVE